MIKVTMPRLSVAMTDGIVVEWFKSEGETVNQGEPLLEVETEKVTTEVEAPASGVLLKILAPEGSLIPVGKLIAIIAEPDEELPPIEELIKEAEKTPAAPAPKIERAPAAPPVVKEEIKISPLARRLAEKHNIDIKAIKGSGPGGRIVKEDVLRAIEEAKSIEAVLAAPSLAELAGVSEVIQLTGIRKTIADRLSRSYREAVHVSITIEVDMTEVTNLRQRLKSEVERKAQAPLSYTVILVKAVAIALKKNPIVNSTLEGDEIKILRDINIGVAVALKDGLIVPVIHNADKKSLSEIAICLRDLAEKAKQNRLELKDVEGGTFTITNLGMFGINTFMPIINPPQSAILGVGTIKDKLVMVDGEVVARPVMNLTLVFDHRIFDGVPAATFMRTLKEVLERPSVNLEVE